MNMALIFLIYLWISVFRSYLQYQIITTVFELLSAETLQNTNGVPQGSVLGPFCLL